MRVLLMVALLAAALLAGCSDDDPEVQDTGDGSDAASGTATGSSSATGTGPKASATASGTSSSSSTGTGAPTGNGTAGNMTGNATGNATGNQTGNNTAPPALQPAEDHTCSVTVPSTPSPPIHFTGGPVGGCTFASVSGDSLFVSASVPSGCRAELDSNTEAQPGTTYTDATYRMYCAAPGTGGSGTITIQRYA